MLSPVFASVPECSTDSSRPMCYASSCIELCKWIPATAARTVPIRADVGASGQKSVQKDEASTVSHPRKHPPSLEVGSERQKNERKQHPSPSLRWSIWGLEWGRDGAPGSSSWSTNHPRRGSRCPRLAHFIFYK